MGKFAAVPETWAISEIELYQKNVGVDGYVVGLSEDLRSKYGEVSLPFVWEEAEPEVIVIPSIINRLSEAKDLEELKSILTEALQVLGLQ